MIIFLPENIKNNIYKSVKTEYPKECCGILLGKVRKQVLICEKAINTKNIAPNPYQFFEIDNQELINIQKLYRKNNLSIIGHYHSHPNSILSSKPSKTDINSIFDKNLCWLIIGINGKSIELSAYFPVKYNNNSYNLKKINIK